MSKLKISRFPLGAQVLALEFLNSVSSAAALAGNEPQVGPILDDPSTGFGDQIRDYDIGMTVAKRILARRWELGAFTSLLQLEKVKGFGQDKLNDLLFTFGGGENEGDGFTDDPGTFISDPPEKEEEACLEIIPFDCEKETCNCKNVFRSEPGAIRLDGRPDALKIAYTANNPVAGAKGTFRVDCLNPFPRNFGVAKGTFECSTKKGKPITACLEVLNTKTLKRTTALGKLTLANNLRPFMDMETYRITLNCGKGKKGCKKSIVLPVVDGDLIRFCYSFGYNQAGLNYWVKKLGGKKIPANRFTYRQFAAALAENGGNALIDAYYKDLTGCKRTFKNPIWAACVSAVLAEDFYKANVWGTNNAKEWTEFFKIGDFEVTKKVSPKKLKQVSALFGTAHLGLGLRLAISKCPPNPCCAHDLFQVTKILVKAQTDILKNFKFKAFDFEVAIANLIGQDSVTQFKKSLRQQMLDGLEAAKQTACKKALEKLFDENP